MRRHTLISSTKLLVGTLLMVCCSVFAEGADDQVQTEFVGWGKAGYNPEQYQTGFLEKLPGSGRQIGFIKSLDPSKRGFGTLMRTAAIQEHRGKRIQLTSFIKTSNADSVAAWFRVNGKTKTLAFDNMSDRRIKGSKDWDRVNLVLDIPVEAESVSYGIMLEGKGKVWFETPTFQVVDQTVRTTNRKRHNIRTLELESKSLQVVGKPRGTSTSKSRDAK